MTDTYLPHLIEVTNGLHTGSIKFLSVILSCQSAYTLSRTVMLVVRVSRVVALSCQRTEHDC